MALVRPYHKYRGVVSFSMADFVSVSEEQIALLGSSQTRYRVTDSPDERTIRFYTAQGAIDKPIGRKGRSSVYGYRHLLQILVIKHLQSRGIPLATIRVITAGADNRELELFLPDNPAAARQGIGQDLRRMMDTSARVALRSPTAGNAASAARGAPPAEATAASQDTWHRMEVGPGLELHVHSTLLTEEQRERLRGALLREIGILRGWFDGDGGRSPAAPAD